MKKPTILIDGDILLYKTSTSVEKAINWGDEEGVGIDVWTLHSFPDEAEQHFINQVNSIKDRFNTDKIVMVLSDRDNFRKKIDPEYKANRVSKRKPLIMPHLRSFVEANYNSYIRPTLEADDVIGILSTSDKIIDGHKITASSDKDFKTIPGHHWNLDKDELFHISEVEADYHHMIQTLCGDRVDNYPGCPGVGHKTAEKLLQPFLEDEESYEDTWLEIILPAFEKKGLTKEDMIKQARSARILRSSDYNFKKKEPILWTI